MVRELQSARIALAKDMVRLQNQIEKQHTELTRRLTSRRLALAQQQITELDQAIQAQLETCPTRNRALAIFDSIKGIGPVVANRILVEPP